MNISDDYLAKLDIWVRENKIVPAGPPIFHEGFISQKFSNYEDFNRWKRELILAKADKA